MTTDHIDYLGRSIHAGILRLNNDNLRGLWQTPTPTSPREVFRFVKAAEYYRKFVHNFSAIAGPVYKYAPSSQSTPSQKKHLISTFEG
jgi:hypothetical protein